MDAKQAPTFLWFFSCFVPSEILFDLSKTCNNLLLYGQLADPAARAHGRQASPHPPRGFSARALNAASMFGRPRSASAFSNAAGTWPRERSMV